MFIHASRLIALHSSIPARHLAGLLAVESGLPGQLISFEAITIGQPARRIAEKLAISARYSGVNVAPGSLPTRESLISRSGSAGSVSMIPVRKRPVVFRSHSYTSFLTPGPADLMSETACAC